LGEYSYVENKVFPLYTANSSRIARRLLRKIAQFKYRRSYRKRGVLLRTPSESPQPVNSESTDDDSGAVTTEITLESTKSTGQGATLFALGENAQTEIAGQPRPPMKHNNGFEKGFSPSVGEVTVAA